MDPNSPCKDLLFPRAPNLAQKPLYLVGTVLKFEVATIFDGSTSSRVLANSVAYFIGLPPSVAVTFGTVTVRNYLMPNLVVFNFNFDIDYSI